MQRLRTSALLVVVVLVGCVGDSSTPAPLDAGDASTTDVTTESGGDAIADASDASTPVCDLAKPFDAPVPLTSLNTAAFEEHVWLSEDELTAYLTTIRGDGAAQYRLFTAVRSTRTDSFAAPVPLPVGHVDGTNDEDATVTADGLTLMWASPRAPSLGSFDIWVATRPNTSVDFGSPSSVAGVNGTSSDSNPTLSANGNTLYLSSMRAGGGDIFEATKGGGGYAIVSSSSVAALNDPTAADGDPVPTRDGLTVYFSSSRTSSSDIWVAHRSTTKDGFAQVAPVTELNTTSLEWPEWVSPDGCRLYLGSNRPGGSGGYDQWVASKPSRN